MRTLIIGDVHGCRIELQALLERLSPSSDDRFVFLGDLIDRGPEPEATVALVRELSARLPVVVLRGNHEHKHLRFLRHAGERGANPVKLDENQRVVHGQVSREAWLWLAAQVKLFHRVDAGLLAVHAGVLPSVRQWPADEAELEQWPAQRRKSLETSVLYARDIDAQGHFLSVGKQVAGQRFWGEAYDGRFGHVVHGHSATDGQLRRHAFSTGIDTGCVYGFSLTAAVWHGPVPAPRPPDELVQVPATQAWAAWKEPVTSG